MSRGAHKRWSRFGKIGFFSFPAFVPIWRVGPPGHAAGRVELKGELKMAVHSGFLSYRNDEGSPAQGGSALHRGPCTSDIIGGVKTEKEE